MPAGEIGAVASSEQSVNEELTVEVSDEQQLRDAVEQASKETCIRILLTETVYIKQPLSIEGKNIVLQGTSDEAALQAAYVSASKWAPVKTLLTVGDAAAVTIADLDVDADGTGRVICVQENGDLTLENGAAVMNGRNTCSSDKVFGIGIYVADGGHVLMQEGAEICNHVNPYDAEGVGVCNIGTFCMNGGSIYGNLGEDGARSLGIGVNNAGSFIMKGGEISQNKANMNEEQEVCEKQEVCEEHLSKGGAFCQAGGALMISGNSAICGNTADLGGGIFAQGGSVSVTGSGVKIYENRACSGGAAYICGVQSNMYGRLWMNGVVISDNEAVVTDLPLSGNGAGIYVDGGCVTMISGNIRDNYIVNDRTEEENHADAYISVKEKGGGIYLAGCDSSSDRAARSVLFLNGGTISGNQAVEGGGIYAANYCLDMDTVCYGNADFRVKGAPKVLDNIGGDITLAPAKAVLDAEPATNVYPQTIQATGELQVLDSNGKISGSAVLPVYKEQCRYIDIDGKTKTDSVLIEE